VAYQLSAGGKGNNGDVHLLLVSSDEPMALNFCCVPERFIKEFQTLGPYHELPPI
jgi:hypothetical protein